MKIIHTARLKNIKQQQNVNFKLIWFHIMPDSGLFLIFTLQWESSRNV